MFSMDNSEHLKDLTFPQQNPKDSESSQFGENKKELAPTTTTTTDIHTIHTYNTYIQLKDIQSKERRQHFTTSYSPTIYQRFREAVHRTQPYLVKPNRVLEDFMIDYIVKSIEDRKQPKITQFFINADQVNVAKKQVVIQKKPEPKPIDYSKFSLEELQSLFDTARKLNRMGQMQTIAYTMKKRGVIRRSY